MLKKSLFFVSLDSEMVHTHINDKERKKHTTDHTYIYSISSLMPEKASWYISYENTTFTFEKYLDWFEKKMTQTLNLKTSCNIHETIAFQWFWGWGFFRIRLSSDTNMSKPKRKTLFSNQGHWHKNHQIFKCNLETVRKQS